MAWKWRCCSAVVPLGAWHSGLGTTIFGSLLECHGGEGAKGLLRRIPQQRFLGGTVELRRGGGIVGVE
jgi:hypothetical protein